MFKRVFLFFLIAVMLVTITACSANNNSTVLDSTVEGNEKEPTFDWRCAVISYDNSFVTQYKYDSNGKIAEIVEFQNEGLNAGDEQSVSCNRIAFNEKGSISSVTTSANGISTEVIDAKTWCLHSDSYSLTVSYNDLYLCETQIMDLVNDVKVTTKTNYDDKGRAISAITEYEYYGENQKFQSITNYEYEYDCNGNPVIQYSLTEDGKHITATYSWEH